MRLRPILEHLSYLDLEKRRLLAGMFAFDGDLLKLDMTTEDNTIFVSQDSTDYLFTLANGNWTGTDQNSANGSGTRRLSVDQTTLDAAFTGIELTDVFAVDGRVVFDGSTDFSAMDGSFIIENQNLIGQSPASQTRLGTTNLSANTVWLPNNGNRISGVANVAGDFVNLNVDGNLRLHNVEMQYGVLDAENELIAISNVFRAENLRLIADSNISVSTFLHFDVGTLRMESHDIDIQAHSSGFVNQNPNLTNLGRLNFSATGRVDITTDDDSQQFFSTYLFGDIAAARTALNLKARIVGTPDTSITIEGSTNIRGIETIWLGHYTDDVIELEGQAYFEPITWFDQDNNEFPAQLSIGEAGQVNFGTLAVSGTPRYITIFEDSTTNIDFLQLIEDGKSLTLHSAGAIHDEQHSDISGIDRLTLDAAQVIVLNENIEARMNVGATVLTAPNIYVGGYGYTNMATVNFNSPGVVRVYQDTTMQVSGSNTAHHLTLHSNASIANLPGVTISTNNGMSVTAIDRIRLANSASDVLSVNGAAFFNSGISTIVGHAGQANFVQLSFRGGYTRITESSNTHLVGENMASQLFLTSSGYISDANGMSLSVDQGARLTTPKGVLLADAESNIFEVCGHLHFAVTDFARLESPGSVYLNSYSVAIGAFRRIFVDGSC